MVTRWLGKLDIGYKIPSKLVERFLGQFWRKLLNGSQ